MINTIEEDYCSFEIAKLLKEKGFDCNCNLFMKEGEDEQHPTYGRNSMHGNIRVYIPRHALAIKWIRENFQINIGIAPCINDYYIEGKKIKGVIFGEQTFKSLEEATEAAILYTLQNLIP